MYAETIDTGATVSVLRAFGPPEVVDLKVAAGSNSAELAASGFWTLILAVHVLAQAQAAAGDRYTRVSFKAIDPVPFAQVQSPFAIQANQASSVTFAVGVQPAGFTNAPTMCAPLPELVLLPGWSILVDDVNNAAPAVLSEATAYIQRYQLIDVDDLLEG